MTTQTLPRRAETARERPSGAGTSVTVVARLAAAGGALLTILVSLASVAALALLLGWIALNTGLR